MCTEGVRAVRLSVHRRLAFPHGRRRGIEGDRGRYGSKTECAQGSSVLVSRWKEAGGWGGGGVRAVGLTVLSLCPTLLAHHQVFGMLAFVIIIFLSAAFTDV